MNSILIRQVGAMVQQINDSNRTGDIINSPPYLSQSDYLWSGLNVIPTTLIALGIAILIVFCLSVYIYWAFVWMTTARKLKYKKTWLAWIPIANLFLIPILAKKKWTWGFMFLVPIANIVFWFIWTWKIFERRKLHGFYSLALLIPSVGILLYLIALGFLAWRK